MAAMIFKAPPQFGQCSMVLPCPEATRPEPLVSFQINLQLSGWNLPPLMIRAFGAHGHNPTSHRWFEIKQVAN